MTYLSCRLGEIGDEKERENKSEIMELIKLVTTKNVVTREFLHSNFYFNKRILILMCGSNRLSLLWQNSHPFSFV